MKSNIKTFIFCIIIIIMMFSYKCINAQTVYNNDYYPFTRVSTTADTLFIIDNEMGNDLIQIWKTYKTIKTPILIYTNDVDFILRRKSLCENIVKTIVL